MNIAKTTNTKVIIICKIHGDFLQAPIVHLRGNGKGCGCPKCSNNGQSKVADRWLSYISLDIPEFVKEFRIPTTRYSADGYNPTTNTIYEFHGDFWHGNPSIYNHKEINSTTKTSYGSLFKKTMKPTMESHNFRPEKLSAEHFQQKFLSQKISKFLY